MKQVTIYQFTVNGEPVALSDISLTRLGITPERLSELKAEQGETVTARTMDVRTPFTYGMSLQVQRACQVIRNGELAHDDSLSGGALVEAAICRWDFEAPLSAEGFSQLPIAVARAVLDALNVICYPTHMDDSAFFELLRDRPTPS